MIKKKKLEKCTKRSLGTLFESAPNEALAPFLESAQTKPWYPFFFHSIGISAFFRLFQKKTLQLQKQKQYNLKCTMPFSDMSIFVMDYFEGNGGLIKYEQVKEFCDSLGFTDWLDRELKSKSNFIGLARQGNDFRRVSKNSKCKLSFFLQVAKFAHQRFCATGFGFGAAWTTLYKVVRTHVVKHLQREASTGKDCTSAISICGVGGVAQGAEDWPMMVALLEGGVQLGDLCYKHGRIEVKIFFEFFLDFFLNCF